MTEAPATQPLRSTSAAVRKTVLVVDLAECVRLMQTHESDVVDRWQRFLAEVTSKTLPQRGGRFVKSTGDGFIAVFDHAPSAAAAAVELHQSIAAYNQQRASDALLCLRVGLHMGALYEGDFDIFGDVVNLAVRLMALATPGETVVSADVNDVLVPGVDADVEDLGDCFVKHVDGPVRAYRLGQAASTPLLSAVHLRLGHELKPGIAVIPFECSLGHDPGDLLGEAMADEVISLLARSAELHVISGLSTRGLKGRRLGVQETAVHLGAAYLLSGRYRTAGDRVRLNLELADVRNERIVWAEVFETTAHAAFDLDDPLAGRIALGVAHAVLARELERASTFPLPALESYSLLFGAITLMHRLSLRDFDRSRAMLDELAYRHNRSPLAHAWLAKWHVLRVAQGWAPDPSAETQQAFDRVHRALDANPRDGLALAVGGLVHVYLRKDLPAAGRYYDDALQANPSEPLAWLFSATWAAYHGDGPRAAHASDMALRLSPLDPMKYFFDSLAATAVLAHSDWVRSEELSRRSIRANRTHGSSWRTLAYALVMQGKDDEARSAVSALLEIEPGLTVSRFRSRFPGSEGPMGEPWARALRQAGLPEG